MPVLAVSHDPSGLRLTGGATIDFANSISFATGDILQSFNNLLATTQPANSPAFGGIEDSALGNASYAYNSSPFGNCGLLNGGGAAYLSYTFGAEFRYRYSTAGHVITEIDFGDGWHVVETYGRYGAFHLVDQATPEGQNPFYTLVELQEALHNGDPTSIWLDVPTAIRDYYGDSGATVVDPLPTDPTFVNQHWSSTSLTLAANEQTTFGVASYTLSNLYGMGAVAPLDTSAPDGLVSATLTRDLPAAGAGFEHIETTYAVSDVKLQVKAGMDSVPSYFPAMGYDSLKIYPVAPEGTIALPGFTPGVVQDWTGQWSVTAGALFETGRGGILSNASGGVTRLAWNQSFTNANATPVQVWIPVAFRTDTPSLEYGISAGPLAVLHVGDQDIALDASDMELHYRDVLVTIPANTTVDLSLEIAAGRSMQLLALGTELDLSGILSPGNAALAVDVDVSPIGTLVDQMELRVALTGDGSAPPAGSEPGDVLDALAVEAPLVLQAYQLNELIVTRSNLLAAGNLESIENPYLITRIDLQADGGFDIEAAREALRVFAAPPSWTVAAPGFERGVEQDWLGNWSVTRGATHDVGDGVVVYNPDGTYSELHSSQSYTNTTTEQQFLWFPVAYRTDTPSRPADGQPVATLLLGEQWFNFYATDLDLHYKGIIVSVEPGATISPAFYVYGDKTIEVYALGTSIEISDFISPENPVQAVDVDFSGLAALGLGDFRDHVELTYALMVNPYLSDEMLNGGDGDDTLVGSDADNIINGGMGADFIDGGAGRDRLLGGDGNDSIVWDAADQLDEVRGGAGTDTLRISGDVDKSFDLTAHEFERALCTYADETQTQAWTEITDEYAPGWVLVTQRGTYVTGSSWLTRYEISGSETWDYSVEYFDGQGRASGNYVHADDGTSYGIVLDAADVNDFAYYVNYLDDQSRQVGIQFVQDDGSSYGVNSDAADEYEWASAATFFDAHGHLLTAQTRYDDGRFMSERLDPHDVHTWSNLTDFIDSYGRLKAQGVHFDDGSSAATYFDVDDLQAWQFETFEFDANGQLTDHTFG